MTESSVGGKTNKQTTQHNKPFTANNRDCFNLLSYTGSCFIYQSHYTLEKISRMLSNNKKTKTKNTHTPVHTDTKCFYSFLPYQLKYKLLFTVLFIIPSFFPSSLPSSIRKGPILNCLLGKVTFIFLKVVILVVSFISLYL